VQWFLGVNGQQQGPFTGPELPAKVSSGELDPQTLVWTAGMEQWQPAHEIAALAPVLSIAPPPLPAAPVGPASDTTPAPAAEAAAAGPAAEVAGDPVTGEVGAVDAARPAGEPEEAGGSDRPQSSL
jgi:hypothetical protein